jgi:hypothetical protein
MMTSLTYSKISTTWPFLMLPKRTFHTNLLRFSKILKWKPLDPSFILKMKQKESRFPKMYWYLDIARLKLNPRKPSRILFPIALQIVAMTTRGKTDSENISSNLFLRQSFMMTLNRRPKIKIWPKSLIKLSRIKRFFSKTKN